jgi:membrane protein
VVAIVERLDRYQHKHPIAAFTLAVLYKFFDDQGAYLAALITFYGFVSLIPLLLLSSTILGLVFIGHPAAVQHVLNSALHQFPVVGSQLNDDPRRIGAGVAGLVVGIIGSIWGGLGVAQAIQYAMNTAWRVPRNERPNPFKSRGRSLWILGTGGLAIIGTTVLSAIGGSGDGTFGIALRVVMLGSSVALNAVAFVFVFRIATARELSIRDVAFGAITAALFWQLLQSFGVLYVRHVVKNASETNGAFAFVLGLVAFLYLTALAVVLCVEIDVVNVDKLYPRSVLTPFTDNVILTPADRRAYSMQVKAQRMKGFEQIDVQFDRPDPPPTTTPLTESRSAVDKTDVAEISGAAQKPSTANGSGFDETVGSTVKPLAPEHLESLDVPATPSKSGATKEFSSSTEGADRCDDAAELLAVHRDASKLGGDSA